MTYDKPKLYIGNISYLANESDIRRLLSPRRVLKVDIMIDRYTGKARGFAFAEMASEEEACSAIRQLHQTKFGERTVVVKAANERRQWL
jgi:RNA recognition motif-containing protein